MIKKSLKILLVFFCFAFILTANCGALTHTDEFFVNDFANIIDSNNERAMLQMGEYLYKSTTAQVVAVTVNSLDGKDIESYAISLAREWGIGSAEKNNGVLLILALDEREVRIEVGSGLEGALNDAKCGRILDTYGIDYFKQNNFSEGLFNVYYSLINEVHLEETGKPFNEDYDETKTESEAGFSIMGLIGVIVLIIILRGFRGGGGGGFLPLFILSSAFRGRDGGGFSDGGFSGGGGGFSGGGSGRSF